MIYKYSYIYNRYLIYHDMSYLHDLLIIYDQLWFRLSSQMQPKVDLGNPHAPTKNEHLGTLLILGAIEY
jgi:hypothetical protein